MKENNFSLAEIKKSRAEAFAQIKKYLEAEDVDAQFDERCGNYHSSEKFIVTWNGNYNGMASEYGIDKTDSFYHAYSGNKAVYVCRSLFHEKQLGGYQSIERALLVVGLQLCPAKEKKDFWDKYVVKYNERLKQPVKENT